MGAEQGQQSKPGAFGFHEIRTQRQGNLREKTGDRPADAQPRLSRSRHRGRSNLATAHSTQLWNLRKFRFLRPFLSRGLEFAQKTQLAYACDNRGPRMAGD